MKPAARRRHARHGATRAGALSGGGVLSLALGHGRGRGRPMGPSTIADLVAKAAPAVVNLDTVKRRPNPMGDLDPYFHGFLGTERRGLPRYFEQKEWDPAS